MSVSIKEVAAAAGVSVGTVSNVLNRPEKVAESTVRRVTAAIDELGFVRNDAARQLRAGRSRSIGLVVLDAANPFFADVARGAEDRAGEAGMVVLLGNTDEAPAREDAYLDLFREQRVNGVLITPAGDDIPKLERLRTAGIPVVLVDHDAPGSGLASVAVDDVEGGYLAVAHLLAQGRRRVVFVGGSPSIRQVADRLEGARRAVREVPEATLETVEVAALTVLQGRAAGERIVAMAAGDRPDAVFAANDLLAVGLLQAFALMSDIRVPGDIALIGYDDIDFASATVVPLSSIRQPASAIGRTAVELLLREIEGAADGERIIRYRPELVVRASSAP
ncbi:MULTISPECIES: LacI family DNA-binding transcriptional regulator [Actinomycetes]|uniref:LacI family DNA-binding transcriptional regulator n=1 Tax=Actinomycetes TaxID=1760 RepID=UPI0008D9630A|nr:MULTISPECIES: LacI family DNA-binding transcriptional regulator [Actinomycetes]MAU80630.1 LacI family transcriptional regulator [Gordonia sp. (in: high G+C Gram-positive bacteria)]